MNLRLSVVICTYNPNREFLRRTMEGLARQTLSQNSWELVIVDNASDPPLEDLGATAAGVAHRIVREPRVGLTRARLAGFAATKADVIVMVDDDNVLAADYLETALQIAEKWPLLGTWGGQIVPEFQATPPEWTRPYWPWLAIREVATDYWSNVPSHHAAMPLGAGMCVRRPVAEAFEEHLRRRPELFALGRTGTQLLSGEDVYLCRTGCEIGFGNGVFSRLMLTHLIPERRLSEEYLLNLIETGTSSLTLLAHLNGQFVPQKQSRAQRLLKAYERMHIGGRELRFDKARERGIQRALAAIRDLNMVKSAGHVSTAPVPG